MKKHLLVGVVLIAFTAILVATFLTYLQPTVTPPTPEKGYVTVVDMANRTVEVPKDVRKVVTTVPDTLRIVVMLDAVDKVVGITSYVDVGYADKLEDILAYPQLLNVARVGKAAEVDIEKIAEVKPDVVFLYAPYVHLADQIEEKAKVPVVCIHAGRDLKEFYKALRLAGLILGRSERAEEVINYFEREVSFVKSRVADIPVEERKHVYLANWAYRYGVGWTTTKYWPLEAAGGINVATEMPGNYIEVSKEKILEWDPDVIFIHGYKGKKAVEEILNDPLLQGVKAVKEGEVFGVLGPYIGYDPKTWIIDVYHIAKTLYPDRFQDVDVIKKGEEVFTFFYGKKGFEVFHKVIVNRGLYLSPELTP